MKTINDYRVTLEQILHPERSHHKHYHGKIATIVNKRDNQHYTIESNEAFTLTNNQNHVLYICQCINYQDAIQESIMYLCMNE